MKVKIITTQFANNMGALLQCYALSRFLNNLDDVDCEVIDYYPKGIATGWSYFNKPNSLNSFIKQLYKLFRIDHFIASRFHNKKVRKFISEYIPLTKGHYDKRNIYKNPPFADVFICGSDQIWNPELLNDTAYFLDFVNSGKKISYAASATKEWTPDFEKKAEILLRDFSAVSLREDVNFEQVKKLCTCNVQLAIDPVFLLNREEWLEIAPVPKENEPYILCYFIGTSRKAGKIVKDLKEATGYKVIHVNLNLFSYFKADKEIRAVSPLELVGYIAHAQLVCTNSFHGTAFSIILHKNFRVLKKSRGHSRLETLINVFDIKNAIINPEEAFHSNLDESPVSLNYTKGDIYIQNSKNYIINNIGLC